MTTSNQQPIDGDDRQSPSSGSNNDLVVSRSVVRRKGVRKSKSGGQLVHTSTSRQQRGTERSRSATSSSNSKSSNLTPKPIKRRVSKFSSRPNLDASIASTNSPTSDGESIGSYSLENEHQTQQQIDNESKPMNSVRSHIARLNREGSDQPETSKRRGTLRRSGSRSSQASDRDVAASPHSFSRKKPTSVLSCDDSLTVASSPSFNSPPPSTRTKIKKQSSTPRMDDKPDDVSVRSERRKARSTSRANGTKSRSSSGKQNGDSEKSKRHSRRSRTPSSKKDDLDESVGRRRAPVSEEEIMNLLNSTNDLPLATEEDEIQQQKAIRRKKSRSPGPISLEPTQEEPKSMQRRRSNSHGALDSRTRVIRGTGNEDENKSEKKEKVRKPPGRSRSNNIGVDRNGLDSFLQGSTTSALRKKSKGSGRGVLSSSKSVSLSGNRTVMSAKSSQSSRRRRKNAVGGKSLKSSGLDTSARELHSDEQQDILYVPRRFFDDSDLIHERDYDENSDEDDRSVDLDLATARDNFAQQNLNEKLQLHLNKTDELLYSVFPKHVADALRSGQKVAPENHELVTIFFSDIVGFTDISAKLDPLKISDMLDRLYNSFDALSEYHDVFKVETIGDAYMAVTNLTKEQPDHCKRITEFAVDAIRVANQTLVDEDNPTMGFVNIRVGFHSGSVVSNVVGTRNPRYCLFGDTVNTASRMESNSEKNRIHCSELSATLLRKQCPRMRIFPRGAIDVKGKGEMKTFWIHTEGSFSARDRNKGTIRSFMKAVRKR